MLSLGLGETSIWTCFSSGVLLLLLLVYLYRRFIYEPMQYFQKVGLPGPKPHFLLGNIPLVRQFKLVSLHTFSMYCFPGTLQYTDLYEHLGRNYGNVCGFYLFTYPEVMVADPEMIKQITIKYFDKFTDRLQGMGFGGTEIKGKLYNSLILLTGQKWKESRHILTPAFTASKMKLMEPLMRKSTLKLVEKLKQVADTDQSVNVLEYYSKMTMEVILATALGQSLEVQDGKGGKVYESAVRIFADYETDQPGLSGNLIAMTRFNFLLPVMRTILRWSPAGKGMQFLAAGSMRLIESRKNKADAPTDLLQLLVDANRSSDNALEDGTVVAHSVSFLLAGYETTSNAITYMSYLLALHPDVQERLANEIHTYLQEHPDGSMYDAASSLEYLDMVFQESLRLYPPGAILLRYCSEDCEISGVQFKKGVRVNIPTYYIHRRADLWPEPEKFDPERFTAEEKAKRHPCAYLPFGVGPRTCIGMRFAILEAKMAMIDILENFRIVRGPETQVPLKLNVGVTMSARNACMRFESREWDE